MQGKGVISEEDKSWLARHSPRSTLRERRGQPADLRRQPSLGVVCTTPGIAHARERKKTLGFIPGLPPCREVLSSEHPMNTPAPLARACSCTGLALLQGVGQEAEAPLLLLLFFILFGIIPPSPHLSSEAGKKRKQEGRKDKEELSVLRGYSKEPSGQRCSQEATRSYQF